MAPKKRTEDEERTPGKEPESLDSPSAFPELPKSPPPPPPKPAPQPKAAPAPQKPSVEFRVWAVASGIKFDQLAGFARYAEKQGLKRQTIPEWRSAYEAFRNRPTR